MKLVLSSCALLALSAGGVLAAPRAVAPARDAQTVTARPRNTPQTSRANGGRFLTVQAAPGQTAPYRGPLGSSKPSQGMPDKPITSNAENALGALYERPAPMGPKPIALAKPVALNIVG